MDWTETKGLESESKLEVISGDVHDPFSIDSAVQRVSSGFRLVGGS